MEMFTITKKAAVLYLKTQAFDELPLKKISLNVPDFLQVLLQKPSLPAVKIFRIQDKPAYRSAKYLKNCKYFYKLLAYFLKKVQDIYKISEIYDYAYLS